MAGQRVSLTITGPGPFFSLSVRPYRLGHLKPFHMLPPASESFPVATEAIPAASEALLSAFEAFSANSEAS